MFDNRPIGIFDSGVGGLTIAKAIKNILPNESIIYYGDSKHLPYGSKSPEVIQNYSINITKFLIEQNCKVIVIACNTASSNALVEIKRVADEANIPIIDVITPVSEKAAYSFYQKIGVIATKATVDSGVYRKTIRKFNRHIKVHELATPMLVPLIEEGLTNTAVSKAAVENYMSHKKLQDIDAMILGCTHYPLIEKEIKEYFDGRVQVIDSPFIVAHALKDILIKNNMQSNSEATFRFYVSDLTSNFQKIARRFFGKGITLELKMLH